MMLSLSRRGLKLKSTGRPKTVHMQETVRQAGQASQMASQISIWSASYTSSEATLRRMGY